MHEKQVDRPRCTYRREDGGFSSIWLEDRGVEEAAESTVDELLLGHLGVHHENVGPAPLVEPLREGDAQSSVACGAYRGKKVAGADQDASFDQSRPMEHLKPAIRDEAFAVRPAFRIHLREPSPRVDCQPYSALIGASLFDPTLSRCHGALPSNRPSPSLLRFDSPRQQMVFLQANDIHQARQLI